MGGAGGIGALSTDSIYPLSRMDKTQYATPLQLPTSAEVISSDYDPKTDAFTGMPNTRFARGGIATLHYDDGGEIDPIARMEEINRPQEWNPESGQVKLQTLADPKDPYGEMKSIDYTIPKDQIKTFIPNLNQETGLPNGSGAYVLKDGSTIGVDPMGIVSAATPGRNDYTLNKEGYYQPTGANLTWDGGTSTLTKKIGGVDVMVPGIYHKGGYQDEKGNLRVNEEGVPVPLAPNYLDSGVGKSGLSDAAPYIAIAALTAATMGAGAGAGAGMLGGEAAFAGMVPASETLLGSMGYLGSAAAPTLTSAEALGSTAGISSADLGLTPYIASTGGEGALGSTVGLSTADLGTTPYIASSGDIAGTAGISSADLGTTPYIANQGAPVYDFSTAYNGPLNYAKEGAKTLTTGQKLAALSLASGAMKSGGGGGGGGSTGPSSTTTTTQAPPTQNVSSNQFNPAMSMPNMFAMNQAAPGTYYQPQTYRYYAQGGVADLGGYAAGGKLLKGAGDGMSDSIVANIAGKQPARLADGEFVVPADVVSHLGNGSTDAGAKHLYRMMDRIRQARTGNSKQGKRINPNKFLPKG
jgi:hypothetical protein